MSRRYAVQLVHNSHTNEASISFSERTKTNYYSFPLRISRLPAMTSTDKIDTKSRGRRVFITCYPSQSRLARGIIFTTMNESRSAPIMLDYSYCLMFVSQYCSGFTRVGYVQPAPRSPLPTDRSPSCVSYVCRPIALPCKSPTLGTSVFIIAPQHFKLARSL